MVDCCGRAQLFVLLSLVGVLVFGAANFNSQCHWLYTTGGWSYSCLSPAPHKSIVCQPCHRPRMTHCLTFVVIILAWRQTITCCSVPLQVRAAAGSEAVSSLCVVMHVNECQVSSRCIHQIVLCQCSACKVAYHTQLLVRQVTATIHCSSVKSLVSVKADRCQTTVDSTSNRVYDDLCTPHSCSQLLGEPLIHARNLNPCNE